MENKKKYSPEEVAIAILKKCQEVYDLKKANTAHEIESGEEPKNDEAECPEQLACESGAKSEDNDDSEESKKKKKVEEDGQEEQEEADEELEKSEHMSVEEAVSKIMSDKYEVHDVLDKLPSEKKGKVLAALRNKNTKKAEMCKSYMEKCGELKTMQKSESKLRAFVNKIEQKRA